MRYYNTAHKRQSIDGPQEAHCGRSSRAIECRDRCKGVIADRGDASAGPNPSERPTERCFGASVRIYSNAFSISNRARNAACAHALAGVVWCRTGLSGRCIRSSFRRKHVQEPAERRLGVGPSAAARWREVAPRTPQATFRSPPCNRFPVNPSLTLLLHRRPNGRLMGRVANDCFEAS